MFIKSASITDFRNILQANVDFLPFTVFRGLNHNGKSSVRQAIELALTSRTQGTDAAGRGANDKIRLGAKKARIDLVLRGKSGDMPLGVTYGPNKTGRQLVTDNPAGFLNWLQANNERLSCVLDSEYFIRQKPEDQKSILASLVLPTSFDFPREIRDEVLFTLRRDNVRWDGNPLQVIEDLYDDAFEHRKAVKSALNAVHIPVLPEKPAHTVDQIQAKLAELRGRLAKLPAQSSNDGSLELGRLIGQKEGVEARIHAAEEEAASIRQSITDVEADVLAGPSLKTHQAIAAKRKVYDSLEAQAQEIARQIDDQNNVISIYTELLADKKCPTCTQTITEDWVKAKVQEVKEIIARMGAKQRDVMTQQKEMGDISESEKLIRAHEDASGRLTNLRAELAQEVSEISAAKQMLRDLQLKIDATPQAQEASPNAELENLNKMIARVEAELTPAIRYEGIVAEIRTATERKTELEKKVAALEKLVSYFGKDGVKATLIKENIDGFSAAVNRVLSAWGYAATLSIEPYSFDVTNANGKTLPLKELSGSEALMFGVALQTAIAVHSRIGTLVVDKADTFISHERNRLMSCLSKLVQDNVLEQAIVMVSDERTEVPQKDGVAFYAAQEGKLVRL